jgi:hypothetical protein
MAALKSCKWQRQELRERTKRYRGTRVSRYQREGGEKRQHKRWKQEGWQKVSSTRRKAT